MTQVNLGEDLDIRRPGDLGAFDDVTGKADHVVAQEVNGQGQAKAGMGHPNAQKTLPDPNPIVEL